jgi:GH15 family glucan-1,4-alpha-glucosidase
MWTAEALAADGAEDGALTLADMVATGEAIARAQEPSGAITWPDGHVDAWDHVECAMALSACGLREQARRGYEWLRASQRAAGSVTVPPTTDLGQDPSARWLARSHSYPRRACSRSPQALSAIAHST